MPLEAVGQTLFRAQQLLATIPRFSHLPLPQGANRARPGAKGSNSAVRSIIARHDARLQPSASPARGGTLDGGILLLGCLLLPSDLPAEPRIGVGELNSLIAQHAQKQNPQSSGKPLTAFEQRLPLSPEGPPVTFLILGFENYHCGRCHRAERLVEKAARRMRGVLERLRPRIA